MSTLGRKRTQISDDRAMAPTQGSPDNDGVTEDGDPQTSCTCPRNGGWRDQLLDGAGSDGHPERHLREQLGTFVRWGLILDRDALGTVSLRQALQILAEVDGHNPCHGYPGRG